MGRPNRPKLDRDMIARAAVELVDEKGMGALTMRALATRLDVQGPSLYNHIASKEELLDAITVVITREIDHAALDDPDWRVGIAAFARDYRAAYLRHPEALHVIARRPVQTHEALGAYDATARTLVRIGLSPAEAAEVSAALDYLVLGSVMETYVEGFVRPVEDYRPDYPALADSLAASDPATLNERGFEAGLRLLLDGLAVRLGH
ncbi:TetR/AcrR family transcriptional regulator C-terminal domain-containing protein [Streptomyces sp. SID3343]|uniref:TetR/AcrR family transcriptional regulator C-terminal domain-containing protein n=1 Tax=Streptomyces sp. SID3343 TaxID=2690260 RepID=UPI001370E7A6|nr:TetR/AcrR family transcriptional regulator C-terminal domain-containing protein [Streptomyces sp. SID3343]MYW00976.1 TetR family transcriptional regulator [Streptomyces sp. SID3343]